MLTLVRASQQDAGSVRTSSSIVSSIHSDWHDAWTARVSVLRRPEHSRVSLLSALVRSGLRADLTLVQGTVGFADGYVDLIAAGMLGALRRRVLVAECTWEPGSRALTHLLRRDVKPLQDPVPPVAAGAFKRLVRAVGWGDVHFCVLSSIELDTFPRFWGIPSCRVHKTLFCWTIDDLQRAPEKIDGIFAGGNSLRDYRALVGAARGIDERVTIATGLAPASAPANVSIGELSPSEYFRQFRRAKIVVVPLMRDTVRTAGQQTYLNAMVLGKPVVVTDSPGVRDYISDGETGIIVPPENPQALAEALRWILDPDNQAAVEEMCARAKDVALARFSPAAYLDRLLATAEGLADSSLPRASRRSESDD
jgi:hypothetical protein